MDLTLYNTTTGTKNKLRPVHDREVRMYHCGPTVYDFAHIGNFRSSIVYDVLRRTLEYADYQIMQVMNITDIDDKTIKRSKEEGVPLSDLTLRYENYFLADLRHLNVKIPQYLPRATEHISGMISLIEKLLADGFAYKAEDGVYFEISKSEGYGALAGLDLEAQTQARVTGDDYDKKNARDFALWKFWVPEDGENVFDAPFGRGRPGWHIECSVMAMDRLGETIDIHSGGADLIFPHHTNEIAQSEAATGKTFVNNWLHIEFLMVDGQKMSKSLNNFITIRAIVQKGFSPLAYRYWVLGAHYRSKANFTWAGLEGAQTAWMRLKDHLGTEVGEINSVYKQRFLEIILDDLDTPRALALAWEVAKDTTLSLADKTATLLDFDLVLGLELEPKEQENIPEKIKILLASREQARQNKNWTKSDEIRDEINALGWDLSDTDNGPKLSRK